MYRSTGTNPSLTDGWCPSGWDVAHSTGRRKVCLRFKSPRSRLGSRRLVKQFAQSWNLPCCQCTETCSHVSYIQNNIHTLLGFSASVYEVILKKMGKNHSYRSPKNTWRSESVQKLWKYCTKEVSGTAFCLLLIFWFIPDQFHIFFHKHDQIAGSIYRNTISLITFPVANIKCQAVSHSMRHLDR